MTGNYCLGVLPRCLLNGQTLLEGLWQKDKCGGDQRRARWSLTKPRIVLHSHPLHMEVSGHELQLPVSFEVACFEWGAWKNEREADCVREKIYIHLFVANDGLNAPFKRCRNYFYTSENKVNLKTSQKFAQNQRYIQFCIYNLSKVPIILELAVHIKCCVIVYSYSTHPCSPAGVSVSPDRWE